MHPVRCPHARKNIAELEEHGQHILAVAIHEERYHEKHSSDLFVKTGWLSVLRKLLGSEQFSLNIEPFTQSEHLVKHPHHDVL